MPSSNNNKSIFKQVANYRELYIYQKAEVLVLLTDIFCKRFLPRYGDRTVDQMNQAARSGKQNIVEGCEAAMTSAETEVKLVN
ncbi:MAG: four helix bundle protein, partial [Bacteroidales bacterium]|nr:four helix bundle protein [Bacteroidales bacterium]